MNATMNQVLQRIEMNKTINMRKEMTEETSSPKLLPPT